MNFMEILLTMINYIILLIMVLISVAFFTLLERKLLSYIQLRKGPNKVGMVGIVQPFNDAIKLFSKEYLLGYLFNYIMFFISPFLLFLLSLFVWSVIPYNELFLNFNYSLLFMFSCMSLTIYFIMMMSWSSNSKYSMLGGLRGVAQVISYEVSMMLIILSIIFLIMSFKFYSLMKFQNLVWFMWVLLPLFFMLLISLLAETNRSPFDFIEGESELVSGFNVEYGSSLFALIFLGEYTSIMFCCMILNILFMGSFLNYFFYLKLIFLVSAIIWIRGVLPRYRYDKLMFLNWKIYLPISLSYLIFILNYITYNL